VIQKQPENFDQLVEAARLAELSPSPLRGADASAVLMDQIANTQTQLKEAAAKWDKLLSAPVDVLATPGSSPNSATNWTQSSRLGPRGGRSTFTPRSGYPPQRPSMGRETPVPPTYVTGLRDFHLLQTQLPWDDVPIAQDLHMLISTFARLSIKHVIVVKEKDISRFVAAPR